MNLVKVSSSGAPVVTLSEAEQPSVVPPVQASKGQGLLIEGQELRSPESWKIQDSNRELNLDWNRRDKKSELFKV